MVILELKQFVLFQVTKGEQGRQFDFKNIFSEVLKRNVNHEEGVILLVALVPHVRPGFFEDILHIIHPDGGEFPEWGGVKPNSYRGMLPTGETIQYILAGNDIQHRAKIQDYFHPSHWFYKQQIILLDAVENRLPKMSGQMIMPNEAVDLLLFGKQTLPVFSAQFPAEQVTAKMEWDDLVLSKKTFKQIHQIRLWLNHEQTLRYDFGLDKRLPPGYRCLFHGSSGTGKTLTASLLGKDFDMPVYRIDLSQIVSKYIGETEKNLENIFTRAEHKKWILFFDEADALFGKRTTTKDSNDRYANQGISYLLQRTELFDGLIILASNLKENIDEAFLRRLNQIIEFPKPKYDERMKLWRSIMPENLKVDSNLMNECAKNYELTGAQILGAVSYVCLNCLGNKTNQVSKDILLEAIKIEFLKEEKIFNQLP